MRVLAVFGVIAVAFGLFFISVRTPAPVGADAPATRFSAGRAMVDIAAMAPVAHPIGSAANHAVRDYLVRRMGALGLGPRVQRAVGVDVEADRRGAFVAAAPVENLIGVLPGRDHALPAVALMAHYDSVPGSPGAADDITSVADILEIVRAIKAGGVPARDVMVVFTDGEEAGLLGAHAFFRDDPAAAHVGFVLNMETRGGGGRAKMFETSANNGAAIDLFRRTAARPDSNSLAVFVYKLMPNDTDFTVAKAKGLAGFNYAFIGRQFDYHSPSSSVAALDRGSVQQMGDEVLPTARALAFSPTLPGAAPDAAYADVFGLFVLAYPAWAGWIVLALAGGLIAVAAVLARRGSVALPPVEGGRVGDGGADSPSLAWRTSRFTPNPNPFPPRGGKGFWGGLVGGLLLLSGAALALHLARRVTGVAPGWVSYRPLLARFAVFEVGMALAGLAAVLLVAWAMARGRSRLAAGLLALAMGLAGSAFGGFDGVGLGLGVASAVLAALALSAPAQRGGSWIGLLVGGWIVLLALQVAAPTITPIVAWPLVLAAASAAITAGGTRAARWAWALAWLIAVVSVGWLGNLFHTLLQGLDLAEAPALAVWLAALSLWPLAWPADPERAWSLAPGAGILALSLAVMAFLHLTSPWSARHPRAVEPLYLVEAASGRAWRIAGVAPDAWTKAVLKADGGAIGRRTFPTFDLPVAAAPARPVTAAPPAITPQRASDGTASLHVAPAAGGDRLTLDLRASAPTLAVTLDGQPLSILPRPDKPARLVWFGSDAAFDLRFHPAGHGDLDIAYGQQFPTWPARATPLPAMPSTDMAWDRSGVTEVVGERRVSW